MLHLYPAEKRLFPRMVFKEKALLISPDFLGLINNISLGGLSFTYCDQVATSRDITPFDITLANYSLTLASPSFQIIDNDSITSGFDNYSMIKRCRVNFNGLAGVDIMRLWRFMQAHCRYYSIDKQPDSLEMPYGNAVAKSNDCACAA